MKNKIKTLILAIATLLLGCQVINAETKRALIVGIYDYGKPKEDPDEWANIRGANDVALLAPLFNGQEFSVTSLVSA